VKNSQNPVWNHEVFLKVGPGTAPSLDIQILDADQLGRDKPLGQLRLEVADLAENGPLVGQWLPLDNAKSGEIQVTAEYIPQGHDDLDGNETAALQKSKPKPRTDGGGAKGLQEKLGITGTDPRKEMNEDDELIPGTLHLGMQYSLLWSTT
jgi:Ca2+-dependent lipid-binding protein